MPRTPPHPRTRTVQSEPRASRCGGSQRRDAGVVHTTPAGRRPPGGVCVCGAPAGGAAPRGGREGAARGPRWRTSSTSPLGLYPAAPPPAVHPPGVVSSNEGVAPLQQPSRSRQGREGLLRREGGRRVALRMSLSTALRLRTALAAADQAPPPSTEMSCSVPTAACHAKGRVGPLTSSARHATPRTVLHDDASARFCPLFVWVRVESTLSMFSIGTTLLTKIWKLLYTQFIRFVTSGPESSDVISLFCVRCT